MAFKRDPSVSQQNGKIDWQLQPKELEETVTYRMGDNDNPFVMRTGEKTFAKFVDWVDVSSCGVYFKNSDPKKYTRQTELNATCTTILAYVIVGMKTENNQPYLAIQKIKTDNMEVTLDFKPVTAAEIKAAFSALK